MGNSTKANQLIVPVYINEKIVLDMLAIMEDIKMKKLTTYCDLCIDTYVRICYHIDVARHSGHKMSFNATKNQRSIKQRYKNTKSNDTTHQGAKCIIALFCTLKTE